MSRNAFGCGLAVVALSMLCVLAVSPQRTARSALAAPAAVPSQDTDTDRDGCTDLQEGGADPAFGGDRDPGDRWDFYDVTNDLAIDLTDTLAILAEFGLQPGHAQYDWFFDRQSGDLQKPWRSAPATGDQLGMDLQDAVANLESFGHSCLRTLPPDPDIVATALDPTVATDIRSSTAFLYSGDNPVQTGVAPDTIELHRAAVLRGNVRERDGTPLAAVAIDVLDHPEFGQTLTRADGTFDLAVNGGGQLTVRYERHGFLSAQRAADTPWQDYVWLPDVVLIPFDSAVTEVDLSVPAMQIARGNPVSDADGARRATVLLPQGTTAEMVLPGGATQPLTTLHVRATEYTVGATGPEAMPAPLPSSSGYTYAAELSVDEAVDAGATDVEFSQPLPVYIENFLGFPVGGAVPSGYYDRQQGQWVASANGRVIKVLTITAGMADLDLDGNAIADGAPALAALGITDAERQTLATLYAPGQSLWRVPVTHFTPWDANWPYGPPANAVLPPPRLPVPAVDDPCIQFGSVIGCEDQSLEASAPVTGTPWQLHYDSKRVPGRKDAYTLEIPLSGAMPLPASVVAVRVRVTIAGRVYDATYAPAPNLLYTVTWDGKDAYGRVVQGVQSASVRISYDYVPVRYAVGASFQNSFAVSAAIGASVTANRQASVVSLHRTWTQGLGTWDQRALGVGGWSLTAHHAYDPIKHTLFLGDGRQRSVDAIGAAITTVAGTGATGFNGDGIPARLASVTTSNSYGGISTGPEGSIYVADILNHRIRRIGPDGIITTIGGSGVLGSSGDGGLATAAQIGFPRNVAVGPDGSVYFNDVEGKRVRRIGPDGIITTFAGTGTHGYNGDGILAASAQLNSPQGIAVGPDGSVYIVDFLNHRVRRVGLDGIIHTVAGTGFGESVPWEGKATQIGLFFPVAVTTDAQGNFYVAQGARIVRVSPDGIRTNFAGNGAGGHSGDGGPATAAQINQTYSMAVAPDGTMYLSQLVGHRVRRVDPAGIITTVAGSGIGPGFGGDGGPATSAVFNNTHAVALAPDSTLYVTDANQRIRAIRPPMPDLSFSDLVFPSEDGRELYTFTGAGRHLNTRDTLTGATLHTFGFDADGRLISVTDSYGNVTELERDVDGHATAVVAPGGQRTELALDAEGWLASVTNPAGEAPAMTYSVDGLLQTFADAENQLHNFTYDPMGRLIEDEDPAGGSTTLVRTNQANGFTVTTTSALGQTRAYKLERLLTEQWRRTVTASSGAQTVTLINPNRSTHTTYPEGTIVTAEYGPDPRFGMLVTRLAKRVRTVPGGQTETTTGTRTMTLTDPNNVLSLQTMTDTFNVNGRIFTRAYNGTTRTMTATSAQGRQTVSVINTRGQVVSHTPATGILAVTFTYDPQGRLTQKQQGTQTTTYGYDALDRVVTSTDAANRVTGYAYDDADRIITKTLPGGGAYHFAYDANGNRTEVTLPGGGDHALGYTPVDLESSYTPPGNGSYATTFNADRELTSTTMPGGRVITQSYDGAHRVAGVSYLEGATEFEYLPADLTARVALISNTPSSGPAQDVAFTYSGGLINGMTATGAAPAQTAYTYDNDFFPTAMNLTSGTDSVSSALLWDDDGLATGFGPFTFARGGPGGALSGTSDTASATSYGYDNMGRLANRSQQVSAQAKYALGLSYDATSRLTGATETVAGVAHTYAYTYDLDGQLTEVRRDGALTETYAYDANGNRTSRKLGAGPIETATYDGQDRLLQRGIVAYTFNADGFLAQRGADTFEHNTRGQLIAATIAGQTITYAYDGLGRRVSRTDNVGTYRYLYGDPASHLITAVRNPAGQLTALFYDTNGMLIALERGGARYYLATDQVGTPRIVSAANGTVVKTLETDSYGNVTADSNPAFDLPIGYAGGLADAATGLVHFGYRDYEPASGRWTTRDPILFSGGQGNLYAYVSNNPMMGRDPSGLFCVTVTAYQGVGGGVSTCITSEGASVCGEVGFGVGASVGVDAGGGLEKTGTEVVAEASYQYGWAEVGASIALDSTGCLRFTPKGQLGPVTFEPGKGGLDIDVEDAPKLFEGDKGPGKIAKGLEFKVAAKGCVQGKW